MFEPKHRTRSWGFRFSFVDAVAISVFGGAATVLWRLNNPLWWMLTIAAGHFFLFCNVFRIARRRELIWSGLYLLNVALWQSFDLLSWTGVLTSQIPVTIAVIVADMRSPEYHGVLADRMNPRLNDYLEERI